MRACFLACTCNRHGVEVVVRRTTGAIVVLAALAAACATTIVHPSLDDVRWASARWPDATLESLEQGRSLYVRSCAGCHNLHPPTDYAPDRWPSVIAEMAPDAMVTTQEQELIARYLSAASARLRGDR